MRCGRCGFENPEGMNFCGECAAPLRKVCDRCGTENPARSKFCGECGAELGSAQRGGVRPRTRPAGGAVPPDLPPSPLDSAPDGERKTITALFADIKGSMELIEDLDPEEARSVVDPVLHLMMGAVHHYEGTVAQSLGDGIFALFGAPVAQEDHPHRAIYAALRMLEESRRYAERLRLERGINLQIRVGINSGEVVVRSIRKDAGHADYVPVGHSTGLAARLEALATPGSVLVTEETRRLTEGFFQFRSLGPASLKGVSTPVPIFEVTGSGPLRTRLQASARRGLARFVGRAAEMEYFRRALTLAKDGRGQLVAVVGEAGLGKSRLFHEFKLQVQGGTLVLETFSVSHGKALPYLPLLDLLRNYFGFSPGDDERQRREKVTGRVLTLDRSLEEMLPYLFSFLGLGDPASPLRETNPQVRRARTMEAVKRVLLRESLNQPVVILVEDLHWLDTESEDFLKDFADSVATTKTLLLVNYRPEYRQTWLGAAHHTRLRLHPLGADHALELLNSLLGEGEGPPELRQLILQKTEGNPFFIEEIVQSLFERGILARRPALELTQPLTDIQIPPTVQGVLQARIDRLAPEEKAFLQTLAVLGKQFGLRLLRQVVALEDAELQGLLDRLQEAEFILEQPAFPDPEYTFKHALTQDVAYRSMLAERRSILHDYLAQAIESVFADRLDEHAGELAHHYSLSGNTPKAVEYLYRSGRRALMQFAYPQAMTQLRRGIDLLSTLPESRERFRQEAQMEVDLASACMASLGYSAPEVGQHMERARELAENIGDNTILSKALLGGAVFSLISGDLKRGHRIGIRLMEFAGDEEQNEVRVAAHLLLGITDLSHLKLESARRHLETTLEILPALRSETDFLPGQDPSVIGLSFLSVTNWLLGFPDRGLRQSEQACASARKLGQPFTLALALAHGTQLYTMGGHFEKARRNAEELLQISTQYGLHYWASQARLILGTMLTGEGKAEEGLEMVRREVRELATMGASMNRLAGLIHQSSIHSKLGQTEAAMEILAVAEEEARQAGVEGMPPELLLLRGEIFERLFGPGAPEAEKSYGTVLATAREAGARSIELRAALRLAQLLAARGETDTPRELLEQSLAALTEGHGMRDQVLARELLERLSGQRETAPHSPRNKPR